MKKIILILLSLLSISYVNADEITDNIIIKAKWYKENYDVVFYPIGKNLEGYEEVKEIVTYGEESDYKEEYCNLGDNYLITKRNTSYSYKRIGDITYIKLENISLKDIKEIKVYEDTNEIKYTTKEKNNDILITLNKSIDGSLLWLFVDTDKTYNLKATRFEEFNIVNFVKDDIKEKILIPDKTWISSKAEYSTVYTSNPHKVNDLCTVISESIKCTYREIRTLRYKKEISYYDNELHDYVKGYLPDLNTIDIKFNGTIPEKIITDTKTEYIYVPAESNTELKEEEFQKENTELEGNVCNEEPIIKYIENDKYIDVYRTPKIDYYIIIALLLVLIIETIIIIKKCRLK